FFQAEDGIRDFHVTGVQTCALPISSDRTASRSSASSATLASIRSREKSSMSSPSTIFHSPLPSDVTGNEQTSPSGTPYSPDDHRPADVQSPSGVPCRQSRTCAIAAFAADAADDAPRAWMIAAPRLATVGMKSSVSQAVSAATSAPGRPPTSAWNRSGYCEAEWLPQIVSFLISDTGVPVRA